MSNRFADPEYEPTDEELKALSRAAFSEVRERHEQALKQLHEQIAVARAKQRAALGLVG